MPSSVTTEVVTAPKHIRTEPFSAPRRGALGRRLQRGEDASLNAPLSAANRAGHGFSLARSQPASPTTRGSARREEQREPAKSSLGRPATIPHAHRIEMRRPHLDRRRTSAYTTGPAVFRGQELIDVEEPVQPIVFSFLRNTPWAGWKPVDTWIGSSST